jgi:acyl-CoA hydrolase
MTDLTPRSPAHSVTTMTEFVLPTHANALHTVFGGQIMAWMDLCAAICAQRHTGTVCVTAGVDDLSFEGPIQIGQVVRLNARVTATFRSSLEVEVRVEGEDSLTGKTWPCVSAFLTFVSVDTDLKPIPCTPLILETDEDRTLAAAADVRRAERLAKKKKR